MEMLCDDVFSVLTLLESSPVSVQLAWSESDLPQVRAQPECGDSPVLGCFLYAEAEEKDLLGALQHRLESDGFVD